MRFSTSTLIALLAAPFLAFADENAFNVPEGFSATAGKSLTLNWDPTTSGTVSLILRSGASNDLDAGVYIAKSIDNSGSYTWDVPSDITRGTDYAIEIVDDSDTSKTNYTPYFVIESTVTVASSTSQISSGAPTSSLSLSTVSSATASSATASSATATSSIIVTSSSSYVVIGTLSSTSMTKSSSGSSSMVSSTSSRASGSSSASAASGSSSSTFSGFAAATAVPFGLLALGALAL